MKKVKAVLLLSLIVISLGSAQIPLPTSPDWTSHDNDYSTGGAFADVNDDGYLDFCISNGNDMGYNYNSVYMNNNGTLETVASWRSDDSGYFGHCYTGDVNNDGLADLAVAYLGGYPSGGDYRVRIYLNDGSGLNPLPWWQAADRHSSFDCCLGDYDLDGDLDLAISAGDAYGHQGDSARIYQNNGGVFDTLPVWSAKDSIPADAIRFCDIDNDGDLDLFVGQRRKVSMYRNNQGVLETSPSWIARQEIGWVLRLDFGDYDQDRFMDLAVASNDQIGDPNSIKVFHNNNGTLDTIATFNMQRRGISLYSSCVAWGDVNGDGYPELAAGGWWRPVVVYANNAGVLDTLPTWQWQPANPNDLVGEALLWTDVKNRHIIEIVDTLNGDGWRKLFSLSHRPIQFLDSACVQGHRIPWSEYCYDRHLGWVSFAHAPDSGTGNVIFYYRYSTHQDLAVTNWNPANGNYIFLNTTLSGLNSPVQLTGLQRLQVVPNPGIPPVLIQLREDYCPPKTIQIYAEDGGLIRVISISGGSKVSWDGRDNRGQTLPAGVYLLRATGYRAVKLVKISER
ncbi:MAG: FG-GAP-like repeat-containing protein [bacterium]